MFTLPLDENQLGRIDYNRGYNDGVPAFYKLEFENHNFISGYCPA